MKKILRKHIPDLNRPQIEIYDDPQGPKFEGTFAPAAPTYQQTIKVVSYNIDDGKEVEQATRELGMYNPLRGADFILLQEMDEYGTNKLAHELQYNYIYYPSTRPKRNARNFGNAVLSRWPLSEAEKLILPHKHPTNKQLRIAAKATAVLPDREVTLYSVHTETYTVITRHRRAQVQTIVDDIGTGDHAVIVGGDFNTVSGRSIRRLKKLFGAIGLVRASSGAGTTVKKYYTRPSAADHIFTRGFTVKDRGSLHATLASDHFPVWVELE
jgi:endonuclease/exonuclease/phosphatase (EEP) superfamily protein YafD